MKSTRTNDSVSLGKLNCQVCDEKVITGIHYGVASCDRCRHFFRKKKNGFKCKLDGQCKIDFSPSGCSACRYKHCLRVGMKKNDGSDKKIMKIKIFSDKRMKKPKADNLGLKNKAKAKSCAEVNVNSVGSKVNRKKGLPKAKLQSMLPDLCSSLPEVDDNQNELVEGPPAETKNINKLTIVKFPKDAAETKEEEANMGGNSLILTKRDKQSESLAERTESICSDFDCFNPHQELDYEYNDDVITQGSIICERNCLNSYSLDAFEKSNYNILHEYSAQESNLHEDDAFDPDSHLVIFNKEETDYLLSFISEGDRLSVASNAEEELLIDVAQNDSLAPNSEIECKGVRSEEDLNELCSANNDENMVSDTKIDYHLCKTSKEMKPSSPCHNDSVNSANNNSEENNHQELMDVKTVVDSFSQNVDEIVEKTSINSHGDDLMPDVKPADDVCSDSSCLSLNSLSLSDIEGDLESNNYSYGGLNSSRSSKQPSRENKRNSDQMSSEENDECKQSTPDKRINDQWINSVNMQPTVSIQRLSDKELSDFLEKSPRCAFESSSDSRSVCSDSSDKYRNNQPSPRQLSLVAALSTSPLRNFKIPKKVGSSSPSKIKESAVTEQKTLNTGGIEDVLDLDVCDKDLELDAGTAEYKGSSSPHKLPKNISRSNVIKLKPPFETGKEKQGLATENDDLLSVMARQSELLGNSYDILSAEHSSKRIDDAQTSEKTNKTVSGAVREALSEPVPFTQKENPKIKRGYCFRSLRNRCSLGSDCKYTHIPLDDEKISTKHCLKFFEQALKSRRFDVINEFFKAVRKKKNPEIDKRMIEMMIKHKKSYEVLVMWKDLEQLAGNKLVQLCHNLFKENKLIRILTKLTENGEWFIFWKIMECTSVLKNFCLPEKMVLAALRSLSQHPAFVPISVNLITSLPYDILKKITIRQWWSYMKIIEETDQLSKGSSLRNQLKDHLRKFPDLSEMFAFLFYAKNGFLNSFPDSIQPGKEMDLVPGVPSYLSTAAVPSRNTNMPYPLQSQRNHMTFHVEENNERSFSYRQQSNKQWTRPDENITEDCVDDYEERKQLSKLAACFLYTLSTNEDMKKCLEDLLVFFMSHPKKTCFRFSSFVLACLAEGIANDDPSRVKRYLSQIGVIVFFELRYHKMLTDAFAILKELHQRNINYIELQEMSGHGKVITRTKLALAVLDVCMKLKKYISAFNILKASDWASLMCGKTSHETERLLRLQLLRDLVYCLLREHHLNEAYLVLQNLFQSHDDDFHILKANYLVNLDLGALCDDVILSAVKSGKIKIAVELYQKAQDCTLTLEQVTLRTLFVACLNCNINAFCENIFTFSCNSGVYPQQKVENWPWCIKIYSYFTHEEICYIFQNYLTRLANFLSHPENHPNISREKQVLKINIEELSTLDNSYVDILNVPSTLEAVVDRILTVASQRLKPPLRVIPKGNNSNRILEVTAKTLQTYLSHLGVKPLHNDVDTVSSVQYLWSNFRRPRNVKISGYINPFHTLNS